MQKTPIVIVLVFLAIVILIPGIAAAKIGVGVGTGKIEFDQPLKMGGIYKFPPLTVINTGDEPAEYGAGVDFKENQDKLSPDKKWFVFTPETFLLDPGQSQVVQVEVSIPLKATPGDYFAYLEGHPVRSSQSGGGVSIGISAAAKMTFTIAPANIFQAIYYRIISIMKNNDPWSYVVLAIITASILVTFFRKYFSFNIGISRKPNGQVGDGNPKK